MERVKMKRWDRAWEPGSPIPLVYFPETSMISVVSTMENGSTAEVGMIGREGMTGLPLILRVAANTQSWIAVLNARPPRSQIRAGEASEAGGCAKILDLHRCPSFFAPFHPPKVARSMQAVEFMRHSVVVAATAHGVRHFVIEGDTPEQARATMAELLVRGGSFTDEVGRVYGAWEIDATSLRGESRPPQASGYYGPGPFRIDGQRIRQTRG
jgi:hypothetical protein